MAESLYVLCILYSKMLYKSKQIFTKKCSEYKMKFSNLHPLVNCLWLLICWLFLLYLLYLFWVLAFFVVVIVSFVLCLYTFSPRKIKLAVAIQYLNMHRAIKETKLAFVKIHWNCVDNREYFQLNNTFQCKGIFYIGTWLQHTHYIQQIIVRLRQ